MRRRRRRCAGDDRQKGAGAHDAFPLFVECVTEGRRQAGPDSRDLDGKSGAVAWRVAKRQPTREFDDPLPRVNRTDDVTPDAGMLDPP
jgi:hypothetical protein